MIVYLPNSICLISTFIELRPEIFAEFITPADPVQVVNWCHNFISVSRNKGLFLLLLRGNHCHREDCILELPCSLLAGLYLILCLPVYLPWQQIAPEFIPRMLKKYTTDVPIYKYTNLKPGRQANSIEVIYLGDTDAVIL